MTAGGPTIPIVPVEWRGDRIRILDQTALPHRERYLVARDARAVVEAIKSMAVRGAPLLGVTAAYGVALAGVRSQARTPAGVLRDLERAGKLLVASRPTAANVSWAVERVLRAARDSLGNAGGDPERPRRAAVEAALDLHREDEAACRSIGGFGAALVPEGANVLTHCNTGALATGGIGTALGVIVTAHDQGKRPHVWVDETRPVLQGARLTAWELKRLGIPMTLVADSAAGSLMARGLVDLVIVGADRMAANGDTANKIGTYSLAVLARHHGVRFYVAAPASTVDLAARTGEDVVIEERDPREVTAPLGLAIAPRGTEAANPAFDVTPAGLITAVVTERGVAEPPLDRGLPELVAPGRAEPSVPARGGGP